MRDVKLALPCVVTIALAVTLGVLGGVVLTRHGSLPPVVVACSEETRLCPGGGVSVSRVGPRCEFAACPNATSTAPKKVPPAGVAPSPVACTMEARVCPDGSAVGRVGPRCEFAPCPAAR